MTSKKERKHRIGRPIKHGAHALIYRDEVIKQYPELVRYTRDCYDGLLSDLAPEGPETLSTAKQIILARVVSKLQVAGLLDIFMGKYGILRRAQADGGSIIILEPEPVIATWLQVNHAILRDLTALGLERAELKPQELSPLDIAASIDAQKDSADALRAAAGPEDAGDEGKAPAGPEIAPPGANGEAEGQELNKAEEENHAD